jgi:chemotaxis protein histidine kinase CheA
MQEDLAAMFREGARENLQELEEALLVLSRHPDDHKEIDRMFRVMHTIKGSSGMLGFERIAHFSHALETEFDDIRSGQAVITENIIQMSLAARDHLEALIEREFSNTSETPAPGEPILLALREAIARQQRRPDQKRTSLLDLVRRARNLVKQNHRPNVHSELASRLCICFGDIETLAKATQLYALLEFARPFREFLAELDRCHLRLTDSAAEIFLAGFGEMETLIAPPAEEPDFDPVALMAAMEQPLLVSGQIHHLLKTLRQAVPALTERLPATERIHWLRIILPNGKVLSPQVHRALEALGICLTLRNDVPTQAPAGLPEMEAAA